MELYYINQGSLFKLITTKPRNTPIGIAVMQSGALVYTDYSDTYRTVNIVKNEKIEEMISLQNWKPLVVCSTSSGDLLVIMFSVNGNHSKVVHYSGPTEKQTIQFNENGKPLYAAQLRL
ncbi:uncharacterized protein LOC133178220 [Saccostrea echinata]|uniref:uncharacterized protein LOC133178220 n=1 Tax=Saccostrea echinata TaxID=191078 RepID=UPI002A83A606|nr:uncharacterized protein LOC133178220 [Saccostrea echinata]